MAFVLSRFSFKLNLSLLGLFLAANLLPPQSLLIPVYRMFRAIAVPDLVQRVGHAAQQLLGADPGQHGVPDRVSAPSC